jgi:hypothetical protein
MSRFGTSFNEEFAQEIFDFRPPLEVAVDWIAENLCPEDVFTDSLLEEWAVDNGFTRIN